MLGEDGKVVVCQTAQGCGVNTTLCIHDQGKHFNTPSFHNGFPMRNDIGDFFAKDACEVADVTDGNTGNTWSSDTRTCTCRQNHPATTAATAAVVDPFCLTERFSKSSITGPMTDLSNNVSEEKSDVETTGTFLSSGGGVLLLMSSILLCLLIVIVYLYRSFARQRYLRRHDKKLTTTNPDDDEETVPLTRVDDGNDTFVSSPSSTGTSTVISRSNTTTMKNQATIEMSTFVK